jgi:hypothetical protein
VSSVQPPILGRKAILLYGLDPRRCLSSACARSALPLPGRFEASRGCRRRDPWESLRCRKRQLRVIYGLDELREKLVAQDADYDDRLVEVFKLFLVHEHPFLLQRERLQLFLAGAEPAELKFVAYHHNRPESFEVSMPRSVAKDLVKRKKEVRSWIGKAHKKAPLFDLPDFWVNFRRWTTRYTALEMLHKCAEAIRAGKKVSLTSAEAKRMFVLLPHANQLPSRAKNELRELFLYAKAQHLDSAEKSIFEIRYGVRLDNEWAKNSDPKDIDTIWQVLRDLPVTNIEGNTKLREINLGKDSGGVYGDNVIEIGEEELSHPKSFKAVLRHEVGHAVHENFTAKITPWLETEFGWRFFDPNAAGVNSWVGLMGGWGNLNKAERDDTTKLLISALGPGERWEPGKAPNPARPHPWWAADFGPRLAFEASGENWFENYRKWYRNSGKAFAMNFWYPYFMAVDESVLNDLVANMPSNYAAMSHFEFFAELYAFYYDEDDPKRANIPVATAQWFNKNIGARNPTNPHRPARRGARFSPRRPRLKR